MEYAIFTAIFECNFMYMIYTVIDVQMPVSFGGDRYVEHRRGQNLPRSLSLCCPSSLLYPAEIYEEKSRKESLSSRGQSQRPVGTKRWWW